MSQPHTPPVNPGPWPASVKARLRLHMERAHAGVYAPPVQGGAKSVADVLAEALVYFEAECRDVDCAGYPHTAALNETALLFIADLFESACCCSLLSPEERRALPAPPRAARPTVFAEAPRRDDGEAKRPATKRPRRDSDAAGPPSKGSTLPQHNLGSLLRARHYASLLPVDYLLRLLATLPALVDHFLRAGHRSVGAPDDTVLAESTARVSWLWPRVAVLLRFLDTRIAPWSTPLSQYQTLPS